MRLRVMAILDRTCAPDVGPVTTPLVVGRAFGNRTHGGAPAFFAVDDEGRGGWFEGPAPVKRCGEFFEGVLCR